jgi:hypothetical protein
MDTIGNDDVVSITPELLSFFPLDDFDPMFYTGKYGSNIYYKLKNDVKVYEYAERFRKTKDWIYKQHHTPTLFFYKRI